MRIERGDMESDHDYEGPEDEEANCFECRHCVNGAGDAKGRCCCPLPRWIVLVPGTDEIEPGEKVGDCALFEPTI